MKSDVNLFMCDFETSHEEKDGVESAWVYLAVVRNIWTGKQYSFDSIDNFMLFMKRNSPSVFYFHNLKFDGEFIIPFLEREKWDYVEDMKELRPFSYTTLIAGMGQHYNYKVCFGYKNQIATIKDSLKIIPLPVANIGKAYGVKDDNGNVLGKLTMNHNITRHVGYKPTKDELAYAFRDVHVVAEAIKIQIIQGLTKDTTSSNALANYKSMIGKDDYDKWFPQLTEKIDRFCRKAYRGGFTFLNSDGEHVSVAIGMVFDANSMYPWAMRHKIMPYGVPIHFNGEYKENKTYPLYIVSFTCSFELKEGKIPMVQIKNSYRFLATEYLKSSDCEEVELYMDSVTLKMFFENYDVYDLMWGEGYMFKARCGMFNQYIDKWGKDKQDAKRSGNKGLESISKLMLNSLYGKFGSNPRCDVKQPYIKDGVLKYHTKQQDDKEPVYIPVAVFTTAWARDNTIRTAQSNMSRFVYSDTDSVHLSGDEPPVGIDVDDYRLGAWKKECDFINGLFIRAKTYMEHEIDRETGKPKVNEDGTNVYSIHCAGMPKACHKYVTPNNFRSGSKFTGKLTHNRVTGGVVLKETTFTIK